MDAIWLNPLTLKCTYTLTYNFTAGNLYFIHTHKSMSCTHWNTLHGLTSNSSVRERLVRSIFNKVCLEFITVTGKQEVRGLSPAGEMEAGISCLRTLGVGKSQVMCYMTIWSEKGAVSRPKLFISSSLWEKRTEISQVWKYQPNVTAIILKIPTQCDSLSLCCIPFCRIVH